MFGIDLALVVSAFVAGVLMFLAPCTLPLIPAFIAFISGTSSERSVSRKTAQKKIRINSLAYVLGFSFVFILFGVAAGLFGSFFGQYRAQLAQIGGVFIIGFGLTMLGVLRIKPLAREYKLKTPSWLTPGNPQSAFVIGAIFALGWTPCVGPVLATVLLIAGTKASVLSGAFLLAVFSFGLALPFLLTAFFFGRASHLIARYTYLAKGVTIVGGLLLIGIGILLLQGNFSATIEYGFKIFDVLGIGNLLRYY